jgi:hypothetical protein
MSKQQGMRISPCAESSAKSCRAPTDAFHPCFPLNGAEASLDLLHLLNNWLVSHIQGGERSMPGRFFKLFA